MLILASASPRRQELLRQIGCDYRVFISDAEEVSAGIDPEQLVTENARRKAETVALHDTTGLPVLAADTVVALDGKILGKPVNEKDAARMLGMISGRSHYVFTGVAFFLQGKTYTACDRTTVWMDALSDEEIAAYIATGEPMDKAGAYAVQGIAAKYISRIDGSFSNVVGLPLHTVRSLARKAGISL